CLYLSPGDFGFSVFSFLDNVRTSPTTASIASFVIAPTRRMSGTSPVQSITVDSTPTSASIASTMAAIFPFKSSYTCDAFVGLGLPDIFALGAAIGKSTSFNNRKATSLFGIRIPTVSNFAVTFVATLFLRFKTYVIGQGEKVVINVST